MTPIKSIKDLEAIYGDANPRSISKVVTSMTPHYRTWIDASRFVVISTVGPEGTDGSPRGNEGSVVEILDERTLLLPDWFGNNRIDTLRNIVRDERVSLMFMVHGSTSVVRVNGTGIVTTETDLLARFEKKGKIAAFSCRAHDRRDVFSMCQSVDALRSLERRCQHGKATHCG